MLEKQQEQKSILRRYKESIMLLHMLSTTNLEITHNSEFTSTFTCTFQPCDGNKPPNC